jgi:hypothetical protein
MGEGLGAGGTPPGARHPTPHTRARFLPTKLFSGGGTPALATAARAHALRGIAREFYLTAVGKLEISQMDAETALAAAVSFDDITCSNREPTGKTIDQRTHGTLLGELPPA